VRFLKYLHNEFSRALSKDIKIHLRSCSVQNVFSSRFVLTRGYYVLGCTGTQIGVKMHNIMHSSCVVP